MLVKVEAVHKSGKHMLLSMDEKKEVYSSFSKCDDKIFKFM